GQALLIDELLQAALQRASVERGAAALRQFRFQVGNADAARVGGDDGFDQLEVFGRRGARHRVCPCGAEAAWNVAPKAKSKKQKAKSATTLCRAFCRASSELCRAFLGGGIG